MSIQFILINKPPNITSHDVIDKLRQITGVQKIGHAGTLDPFAQGLLIVGIGRESTKQLDKFLKLDKTYEATLQLGAVSNTYDKTGNTESTLNHKGSGQAKTLGKKRIEKILNQFIGEQEQIPPAFSAKKIKGKKAYELARQNQKVNLKPQKITIYDVSLVYPERSRRSVGGVEGSRVERLSRDPSTRPDKLGLGRDRLKIRINCSSGTYIRSLAHDIGQALGCGAYLTKLIRTKIGDLDLKDAVNLNKLTQANWRNYILPKLPKLPNKTKILTFGTFDLLHAGHIYFLKQAKKLGDELYVVVARDINVKKIKGQSPTDNEQTRLQKVKDLNLATQVMLGQLNLKQQYKILNKTKPDIIALGYDQQANLTQLKNKLKHYNLKTKIKRLKPYYTHKYKTSKLQKPVPNP